MKKIMTVLAVLALAVFTAPAIAAANPFMDVPSGHWAYDAVAQLASRGVASGYPDGAYKGAQPATRYEMALVTARSLAMIDMEKASIQDVELLKKLVLEFKNELDALGVKAGDLDKRVAVLEDGIGGWKIRGIFRFDAKFADSDYGGYLYTQGGKKNEFSKERFRLFLTKAIDENTYFYAQYRTGGDIPAPAALFGGAREGDGRGDLNAGRWSHLYVDTKLPWDIGLRVGRFAVDLEDDNGLYIDNDALFGKMTTDGFRLTKSFGILNATAVIGRNNDFDDTWAAVTASVGSYGSLLGGGISATPEYAAHMTYILDLNLRPGEKFFLGATGYWITEDSSVNKISGGFDTYSVYGGYNLTPSVGLKGAYYFQEQGAMVNLITGKDNPKAWKAILDVRQEALKYTSLWVEYGQQDNAFIGFGAMRYGIGGSAYDYVGRNWPAAMILNRISNDYRTSKWWFATAKQQWNDKLSTFVRYVQVDFDAAVSFRRVIYRLDDVKSWGVGVGYQYTPAVYFELAYDQVDHGDFGGRMKAQGDRFGIRLGDGKESVFRFRTTVNF